MSSPAPIALFVYNRLFHTKETVSALEKNTLAKESELCIFSDGPKNSESAIHVEEVRKYLKSISGFKKITITERPENLGLARSIISGVTDIVSRYGKIIVIEDDLVTSPYFLQYMNDALDFYEDADEVISIHGYVYPTKKALPETFFIKGADCWGWATWKRGWDIFEPNGEKLLAELKQKKLINAFDFNGCYNFTEMLRRQIAGKNDSWAIRWYASAFLKDKLTLYPGKTLVENIGNDGSGTHCESSHIFENTHGSEKIMIRPLALEENKQAKREFEKFFKSTRPQRPSFLQRVQNKVMRILQK